MVPDFQSFSRMALPNKRCTKLRKMVCTFYVGQPVSTVAWSGEVVGFNAKRDRIIAKRSDSDRTFTLDPFVHITCCGGVPEHIRQAAERKGY